MFAQIRRAAIAALAVKSFRPPFGAGGTNPTPWGVGRRAHAAKSPYGAFLFDRSKKRKCFLAELCEACFHFAPTSSKEKAAKDSCKTKKASLARLANFLLFDVMLSRISKIIQSNSRHSAPHSWHPCNSGQRRCDRHNRQSARHHPP